jgi:hypothetical protein
MSTAKPTYIRMTAMDDATVIALELAAEFDEFAIDGSLP